MSSPGEKRYLLIFVLSLAICTLGFTPAFALTADPMDLSVGARSQGMGRAYVAIAEDSETVFVNPAGLGTISSIKLGSMYTGLLSDAQYSGLNYTVLSGAYPMDNDSGTLGAGIINQSADKITLYSEFGTPEGYGTYGNYVLFVSHGFDMSKRLLPDLKGLYGGYTVKYSMKSATGWETSGMAGYGLSADLGFLYKPHGSISYGLSLQNILAGKTIYESGLNEDIGSSAKVGARVVVMGDASDAGAMFQNDSRLDFAVDYDMGLSNKVPGTTHLGIEYKPQVGFSYIDKILTLRAGLNQIPAAEGNLNSITTGIGINYLGTEFNFAYCPSYGDVPDSSTYYVSISYVGLPKVEKPIEEMKPLISKLMPEDKIVTKNSTLLVQGAVTDASKVEKVEINGAGVKISDAGAFEMNVPLPTTGKHLVNVKATDLQGKTEERSIRVVRMVKFADVAENHWADSPIAQLATAGLVEGYPNGTFQPERALSRAELATLLVKSKGIEPPVITGKIFKDVPSSHWASKYIKGALDMGLVTGYPDKTFKPNNKINRTEGVVVLTRFGQLTAEAKLDSGPYPDLTARYWASPLISAARSAGLLDYIGDNDFEPKRELTRAEAVEILSKTSYGRARIDTLLDWAVGFVPEVGKPAIAAAPAVTVPGAQAGAYGRPVPGKGSEALNMKDFSDIADDYWASEAIRYLATAGVMNGYPDGKFRPERVVTRAELSSLLVKAKEVPVVKGVQTGYSDLSGSSWAAPYVKAAVDAGYMTGRKGNKFEPNRGASRAETVAAIVTFDNVELPLNLKKGPFPDMTARDWSSKYVAAAKESGMLDYLVGQDFEPDKSITRAEVASMLAKTRFGQAKIESIKSSAKYDQPY